MNSFAYTRRRRGLLLGILILLAAVEIRCFAAAPADSPDAGPNDSRQAVQAQRDQPANAAPVKRVAFEMRGTPWNKVLEWLADQSGLSVATDPKPTGSFTFITPKNRQQGFTLPEIVDLLNEALTAQRYVLIRRTQSYAIIPSDRPIDAVMLPQIGIEELGQHGNTELVQVILPLKSVAAADAAKEVQELLSPFGKVTPLLISNKLLVQETVGNIKRVRATVEDMEQNGSAGSFQHRCVHVDAREAVSILKELWPDDAQPIALLRSGVSCGHSTYRLTKARRAEACASSI
jgi:type II secretory pathway component GspD/PulD (secretin)